MDENNKKVHISETQQPKDFALDDILAEYGGLPEETDEERLETLGDRSKKLVMEQLPDGVDALGFSSLDDVISDAVAGNDPQPSDDRHDPDPANVWDGTQPDTAALAAAGFEVEAPKPEYYDDPESIIAEALLEFGSAAQQVSLEEAQSADSPEQAVDLAAAGFEQPEPEPETEPDEAPEPEPDAESVPETDLAAAGFEQPAAEEEPQSPEAAETERASEEETLHFDDPEAVIEEALREYGSTAEITDNDGSADYAPVSAGSAAEETVPESAGAANSEGADEETDGTEPDESETKRRDGRSAKERFLSPIVALLALIALRRAQHSAKQGAGEAAEDAAAEELPEPEPKQAVRACSGQLGPLRIRGRISIAVCLVMIYLTYAASTALPLTGALRTSPRVFCLMLLILELTVMMAGLNIFTDGMVKLCRGKPDAQSMVACSCAITVLDALVLALMNRSTLGTPLCAASAVSLTVAVWGEYWRCSALRRGFRVLTASRNLYTVSGERGITKEAALLKSRRSIRGFIRRSLEGDYSAGVFRLLTPMLLIASVVLGALAALVRGVPAAIVHDIAMLMAASSAFSATICFSLPYAFAARRFSQNGAAVAGWPGIRDIGRSRNVVITDADVFPKGTLELGDIRILEGAFVDKVISSTASVIAASGSGLAVPFAELIRRNGYSISRVENFEPHDGGGMTAMVNGENVAVGNTGFMNLIGVRVPRKLGTHNAICTAINGALVGIFMVNYRATGGVQEALVTLLHSNLEPIFALRDFNITPQMLKNKFRLPADNFKFPSYSERFRISGAEPDESSRVAAAIAREGMQPLVDAAERGRRLYSAIRIGTLITAAGCVFGLLMMFLLSWSRNFDVTTTSNVITFMLLWLIPSVVITWGVNR